VLQHTILTVLLDSRKRLHSITLHVRVVVLLGTELRALRAAHTAADILIASAPPPPFVGGWPQISSKLRTLKCIHHAVKNGIFDVLAPVAASMKNSYI